LNFKVSGGDSSASGRSAVQDGTRPETGWNWAAKGGEGSRRVLPAEKQGRPWGQRPLDKSPPN